MGTIIVDKERLEQRIAMFCPYHYSLESGKDLCKKSKANKCNLDVVDKIVLDCPYDCPHRNEFKWKDCTLGKCNYVKKVIKELQSES